MNAPDVCVSGCRKSTKTTQVRYSLGLYAGQYCTPCWQSSGYRDEPASAFDPADAGERYEEDE